MAGRNYNFTFSKKENLRFISHLDLVRLFQRAFRRAELPVTITKGFSPRLKISIIRALKLGVESDAEEMVVSMDSVIPENECMERLNAKLPFGVKIHSVKLLNRSL